MSLSELYESNEKFRKYVDKHCASYRIAREQAFEMMIVQMVAKQYMEEGERDEIIRTDGRGNAEMDW